MCTSTKKHQIRDASVSTPPSPKRLSSYLFRHVGRRLATVPNFGRGAQAVVPNKLKAVGIAGPLNAVFTDAYERSRVAVRVLAPAVSHHGRPYRAHRSFKGELIRSTLQFLRWDTGRERKYPSVPSDGIQEEQRSQVDT